MNSENLCTKCHKQKSRINRKTCLACGLKQNKIAKTKAAINIANGFCVCCQNKREGIKPIYCQSCLIKRRQYESKRYQQRVSCKLCINCSTGKALPNIVICLECWWKQKSYHFTGVTTNIEILKKLWEDQNGCCALSGLKLIPGYNASIDHIIPKNKGGTDDINNLQWVLTVINTMKLDNSIEDFIKLCQAVANKHQY